jgi:hypothetical protein
MPLVKEGHLPVHMGMGLVRMIGLDLYRDAGRCACELCRNGMVACQTDRNGGGWDPSRIAVELDIMARHPLVGDDALVCMDHGHGFTKGDFDRFLTVGPDAIDDELVGRHGGASQKQLGRFAYFALRRDIGPDLGFIILTRTSTEGPVRWFEVTPRAIKAQKIPHGTLAPDASELGRHQNPTGRFSIVVIPHPRFRSNDELRDELAPYLPRKRELCGTIIIGGKPFDPPPLASGAIVKPPKVDLEAYLERVERGTSGGIWLVDLTTGFRVGFCPSLNAHLPYPLGRPDLGGDIFLPGLLAEQDTSRGGLRAEFLKGRTWQRFADLLIAHVVEQAKGLLDESDVVSTSSMGRLLSGELADLFRRTYGDPDLSNPPDGCGGFGGSRGGGGGHGGGHGGGGGKRGPRDPNREGKKHYVPLPIGGETWWVGITRDDVNLFAKADDGERKVVWLNAAYDVLPEGRSAQREHAMLGLLWAIARARSPFETKVAQQFVTERRRELLRKQR